MTIDEKISQLETSAAAVPSLQLPAYNWWEEATHGDSVNVETTNFAFPITTAMSFNRSLWRATGQRIGREARAAMNIGKAGSTYWAPVVNLAREPRWGRNLETPGEDPYLSGQYAEHFVQGFQVSPDDPKYLQASACCKHYVANEMESTSEDGVHWDRNHFDATVTQQDLMDSYMVPFQTCVEKGEVSSLMCSYNAVNGVPSCANDWLLKTVARENWGFNGYITSDCGAEDNVFFQHHFTKTGEEAIRDIYNAGTDTDCVGSFTSKFAKSALEKGLITEDLINERLRNGFRVRMRLQHFDPIGPLNKIPASEICSDESKAVAHEGTLQSSTLLKNDGNTLPFSADKVKKVALIGPMSMYAREIAHYYGGTPCDSKYMTLADALAQYTTVNVSLGASGTRSDVDQQMVSDALDIIDDSVDAVVLGIGMQLNDAHEGHDDISIKLSDGQLALVQQASQKAKSLNKPVVAVTFWHVPLDVSPVKDLVDAALHVGQPSVQTLAIGDLLFGKAVPAGRMLATTYPASYGDEVSIFDFNMRPGPSAWPRPDCPQEQWGKCKNGTNPGRTYRFYTGEAVVPFGHGLSYTTFSYDLARTPKTVSLDAIDRHLTDVHQQGKYVTLTHVDTLNEQVDIAYSVNVKNTGSLDADEVVLGFVTPPGAGTNGIPLKQLFGFERVHVKAGETVQVSLYPSLMDFTHVDLEGTRHAVAGTYTVSFGIQGEGMAFAQTTVEATLAEKQILV